MLDKTPLAHRIISHVKKIGRSKKRALVVDTCAGPHARPNILTSTIVLRIKVNDFPFCKMAYVAIMIF